MLERARKLYVKVREFLDWFDDSPLRVGLTLVGAAIVGVFLLNLVYLQGHSLNELFDGVVVELNGGLVDIFLFGLVVVWFDSRREKRQKQRDEQAEQRAKDREKEAQRQAQIDEWNNQLSDFKDWKSEESAHRTAGIVRRLVGAGEKVSAPSAHLERAILLGANLADANFFKANLAGADLREANLAGADLREANLAGADLREANLAGADLREANLAGSDFREANLLGANFFKANLADASFFKANFADAILLEANFADAILLEANLTDADLREANLARADLREVNLVGANLSVANLEGAKLFRADLAGSHLRGVLNLDKAKDLNLALNLDRAINVPSDILKAWKAAEPERLEYLKKEGLISPLPS